MNDRQKKKAIGHMRDLDNNKKIAVKNISFIFKLLDDGNTLEFKDEKSMIEALEINETVRNSKILL